MTWHLVKLGSLTTLLAGLVACGGMLHPDSDDDGLTNAEEESLGTNPDKADSDADGLNDGDEVALGTNPLSNDTDGDGLLDGDEGPAGADPLKVDTDGDGYTDRDEVFEGHNPADAKDKIYKAGWPYYFEKDALKGGGLDKGIEQGKRVGRLVAQDWKGDDVDIWDFYNADKPVIIDVSAQWCPPCNDLARWLHNDPSIAPTYDAQWPGIREAVENGDIYWITILEQQMDHSGATTETSGQWHDLYDDKAIPVLADGGESMEGYLGLQYFPTVFLLNPDLTVNYVQIAPDPYGATLSLLSSQL